MASGQWIGADFHVSGSETSASEHEIGYAGCAARVERLLKARRVKASANRVRTNDSDGLALVARRRDETGGFTRGVDLGWIFCAHFKFLCSTNSKVQIASFKLRHSIVLSENPNRIPSSAQDCDAVATLGCRYFGLAFSNSFNPKGGLGRRFWSAAVCKVPAAAIRTSHARRLVLQTQPHSDARIQLLQSCDVHFTANQGSSLHAPLLG